MLSTGTFQGVSFLKKRIKKLLLFWLFTAAAFAGNGAESTITYRSQAGVPLHCSGTLRRLEHFLKEVFPKTPYRKTPLTIDITGGRRPLEQTDGKVFEANRFLLERKSLTLLSEAGGAMLHSMGKAPENFRLPLFLCGAFRHRERAAKQECRFLGNNRRFNSVEALLREGILPDLKVLFTHVPDEREKVDNEWFDDHARLLFEMLRSRNFKGKAEELNAAAEKLLSREFKAEELRPMVWGNFNLLPPHLAEQELDAILKAEVPTLDKENKPDGKTETVSAAALPGKLLKHPERKAVCSKFASSLLRNSFKLPVTFRSALRKVHDAVLELGRDPAKESAFRIALAEVNRVRQRYADRAAFLDRLERETAAPLRMWQRSCRANALPAGIVTPECSRSLQRAEEYHTGF